VAQIDANTYIDVNPFSKREREREREREKLTVKTPLKEIRNESIV